MSQNFSKSDETNTVFFSIHSFSMYLPKMTRNNYRIFVEKVTDDERLYDVFKIIKYFCMQTDLRYLEEEHDNGDVILFDCNNLSGLKFVAFIPYFIKSLILLLEVIHITITYYFIIYNTGQIHYTITVTGLSVTIKIIGVDQCWQNYGSCDQRS